MNWSNDPMSERPMPEQHSDVPLLLQDWNTFWDQGTKLRSIGVNVDTPPQVPPLLKPTWQRQYVPRGMPHRTQRLC